MLITPHPPTPLSCSVSRMPLARNLTAASNPTVPSTLCMWPPYGWNNLNRRFPVEIHCTPPCPLHPSANPFAPDLFRLLNMPCCVEEAPTLLYIRPPDLLMTYSEYINDMACCCCCYFCSRSCLLRHCGCCCCCCCCCGLRAVRSLEAPVLCG